MKTCEMKTSELKDLALDWMVTFCNGQVTDSDRFIVIFKHQHQTKQGYCWSNDWSLGGPIIERENISVTGTNFEWWECEKGWYAHIGDNPSHYEHGDTPLVAAMRCYVANMLGGVVEIPEELK